MGGGFEHAIVATGSRPLRIPVPPVDPRLAIEMGADAEDAALTIHPHPTLSETVGIAAEVATATASDLPPKRG